jgi:ribosomal-protein-alanine N-acetyltransferase
MTLLEHFGEEAMQKLNFMFEGTLRRYERVNGKFIDLNMYSKLISD